MAVEASNKHDVPRGTWLKVKGMVRVVESRDGVDVLEVKPMPNSVRRRSKRRHVDNEPEKC